MSSEDNRPSRSDYLHVKALALLAILASQIPFITNIGRHHRFVEIQSSRKPFAMPVGEKLYSIDGNPVDGLVTNFCRITEVSNDWVRIQYESGPWSGMSLTLQSDTVQACYEPVSRLKQ